MNTTETKYLFKLPKKNSDKNRLKIYTLENLIESYTSMRFKDNFAIDKFEITISNYPRTIKNFSIVLDVMEKIFEKDNLELISTHTEDPYKDL